LRPSLYIKDDDYRLSFLHGNYITLTNISDEEWARILAQRLSPFYVSVHASDPEVRGKMLGRKGPEPILPQLRELADNKIQVHAQIVLCPGYNDGEELARTVNELAELHPQARETFGGVLSVAVVPVGITQFRERLAAMKTVDPAYAGELLDWAEERRAHFKRTLGGRFVFLSDEFYLNAGRPVPPRSHYEGFPQLEDGVGLVRLFLDDLEQVKRTLPKRVNAPRSFTLVTGEMPAPLVRQLADLMNRVAGVSVNVCVVHNWFFEGNIQVAGLLTGADIVRALTAPDFPLNETVIVPNVLLRDGENRVTIDDLTLADLADRTGRPFFAVDRMPSAAAALMLR
jgi:putative radical SAM enzyme (TIGR03279 family)